MTEPRPIFSGRLRREALPPFLEFMGASNHTGLAELEGPAESPGQLVFQAGQLVYAVCKINNQTLQGAEAARAMLRWRYAHIAVYDAPLPTIKANISGSTMGLMLEAARMEDEYLRERELPSTARVKVRNNISAYEVLGQPELLLLRQVRFGMTVGMLRDEMGHLPVDSALLELMAHGLLEIEGVVSPETNMTHERMFILSMLIPKHTRGKQTEKSEKQTNLQETVFTLANGVRSAEQIRNELNLGPGKLRQILTALKNAGRIEY